MLRSPGPSTWDGTETLHVNNAQWQLCRVNSLELYVALSVVKPVWLRGEPVVRSYLRVLHGVLRMVLRVTKSRQVTRGPKITWFHSPAAPRAYTGHRPRTAL